MADVTQQFDETLRICPVMQMNASNKFNTSIKIEYICS
jgi:hypothetical protein